MICRHYPRHGSSCTYYHQIGGLCDSPHEIHTNGVEYGTFGLSQEQMAYGMRIETPVLSRTLILVMTASMKARIRGASVRRWMLLAMGIVMLSATLGNPALAGPAHGHRTHADTVLLGWLDDSEASFSVSGAVLSVDYDANVIVLWAHGSKVTVSVTPTTSIEKNGESGSFSDIRRGSHVSVWGTMHGEERVARRIIIK